MAKRSREPDRPIPPEVDSHDEGDLPSPPPPLPETDPPTSLEVDSLPVTDPPPLPPPPFPPVFQGPLVAPPPAGFAPNSLPREEDMPNLQMTQAPKFQPVAVGTRIVQRLPRRQLRMIPDRASHAYFRRIFSQLKAVGKFRSG